MSLAPPGRDFGYFPGDIIRIEAVVDAPAGVELDRNSLPSPGALNANLELRGIGVALRHAAGSTRIVIDATYQNWFATDHVVQNEVPGYAVRLTGAAGPESVQVPAWLYSVSPLRPAQRLTGDLPDLRPDIAQPLRDEQGGADRALGGLGVAAVAACALAVRRGVLRVGRGDARPLQRAAREIGRLRNSGAPARESLIVLHRALDQVAGKRLLAADLPAFTAAHAQFRPAAAVLDRFFAASHRCFFGRDAAEGLRHEELLDMARQLRRAEMRQAEMRRAEMRRAEMRR